MHPEERQAYVNGALAGEHELQWEVAQLLKAMEGGESFSAISLEAALMLDDKTGPKPGDWVGPYQLQRPLGQGGMGTVFLAARADQEYERQVAVKFVAPGVATDSLLARFRVERQILAQLEHPHIARLFDGGVAEGKGPYLVMEYVQGTPIDQYCRTHALSIRRRVELFLDVCGAIAYAHSRLVVHRDIKPSNILVTEEGVAKLLDFGIARLLRTDDAEAPALTRPAERLMTLEYASPEQVRGEPVTTASDIYTLGTVLYELLTGRRPFDTTGVDFLTAQLRICETEPARPSSVVTLESSQERRDLKDDLDNVILMAVRKKPEERYASVAQLMEDLRRYLGGFPVHASRDSARYRAVKFMRRHRLAVASAGVFVLVVIGFAVAMGVLAARVTRERNTAVLERARALQERAFLTSLFNGSDPFVAKGRTVTAKDLLDLGAQRINHDLKTQPSVRASLLETMAVAYQHLGLQKEAAHLFEQEIQAEEEVEGPNSARAARVLRELADVEREKSQLPLAEQHLRRALAIQEKVLKPDSDELAETCNNLALVLQTEGDLPQAERYLRRAIPIAEKYPALAADTLVMKSNLGSVLGEEARYPEAEQLLRQVLNKRVALLGDDHPQVALSRMRLAHLLLLKGAYTEAEQLDRESLKGFRKVYPKDHLRVLVEQANLASTLRHLGRLEEAGTLFLQTIRTGEARYQNHIDAARWTASYASLLTEEGRFSEAGPLFRKAIATCHAQLGTGSSREAEMLQQYAVLQTASGQWDGAETSLQTALGILTKRLGPGHPEVAWTNYLLAELRVAEKRMAEALPLFQQAMAIDRKVFPEGQLQNTIIELAYARQGAPDAYSLASRALEFREKKLPPDAWQIAEARSEVGEVLASLGRFREAEPLLVDGYSGLVRSMGLHTRTTQFAAARLAQFRREEGQPKGQPR
jgi:serine/threonine-protein kinase